MGSFRQINIWCDAVIESADMFFLKFESVILGLINLWSVLSVEIFLAVIYPLVDTSKQCTEHL